MMPTPRRVNRPAVPEDAQHEVVVPEQAVPEDAYQAVAAPEREVLGHVDIGIGMPDGAWSAVPPAVTDASMDHPSWSRKTAIDAATPKARPGYVQRWVRIAQADGKPDVANKSEAIMAGWRPRREDTLRGCDGVVPIYDPGDNRGGVMIFKEQLLLCEMPVALHQRYQAQLKGEQDQINRAIYTDAKRGNGMPEKYATLDYDAGRDSSGLID